jgi:hypothetical protein
MPKSITFTTGVVFGTPLVTAGRIVLTGRCGRA